MHLFDFHAHHPAPLPGKALVNSFPDTFVPQEGEWYSVGIHPWYVNAESRCLLEVEREALGHPQVLAVGEAGLDKLVGAPLALQTELFMAQARLAEEFRKPLVVHLVKALDELLALHRAFRPSVPWIVHGFRGKPQQAETLVAHGFYLSFGERFHAGSLCLVPADRLLLETDESLLTIGEICRHVAEVRGVAEEELRTTVQSNLKRLFGTPGGEKAVIGTVQV